MRQARAWWKPARYVLGASAGVVVLAMAFAVQHRTSFQFDSPSKSGCQSCGSDVPDIPSSAALLPAEQFSHALFDQNWIKVERYLAPVSQDREYLQNFKLFPVVKTVTSSDCDAGDIQSVEVMPPVQDSTVFSAAVQMKRMCHSPEGGGFNRMTFQVFPVADEWYYQTSTLRLDSPGGR
jgi:hypothetical protein